MGQRSGNMFSFLIHIQVSKTENFSTMFEV
jgi:hypothetical protein